MKKAIKTAIVLVIIARLGLAIYLSYGNKKAEAAQTTDYTISQVQSGSLSQSVVSTGSLSMKNTSAVTAPMDITIDEVLVQAGDSVSTGTPLVSLDTDALLDTLSALKDELTTQDQTIATLAGQYKETQTIKSPVAGRVKAVYVVAGEYLQDAMQAQGAAALLSLDGLMTASFSGVPSLSSTSAVKLTSGGIPYTATIARLTDTEVTVTFSDGKVMPGDEVQLMINDAAVATSTAQINMPYVFSSDADGLISSVAAKVNATVNKNGTLFTLTSSSPTKAYQDAVQLREELTAKVTQAQALLKDPYLYAQQDGIVATVDTARGTAALANASLMSLYTGTAMQMAISVDELDIIHVAEGQTASIQMDALKENTYEAQVSRISQLGTASSGITNYTVTLDLLKDEQLKLGMNGTATIQVGEQSGLLVPLAALQSDRGGSYVWLYQEGVEQTADAPGIKTYVTTGLSNADEAVITEGLIAGSQVLVVRSAGTAATTQQDFPGGMGTMQGTPPEGFVMPQRDGTTRQDGQRPGMPGGN